MRANIVGSGKMGTCIAYAMSKLGYKITLIDIIDSHLEKALAKLELFGISVTTSNKLDFEINPADIIVSAATFTQNNNISQLAINSGIPYVDLGGDPDVTAAIHQNSKQGNGCVFTDLGLAPGLINIMAEYVCSQGGFYDIKMMVGGLPEDYDNRLKYALSWSTEGLYNEYTGSIDILENGKVTTVNALEGNELVLLPLPRGHTYLESFYTKGAISTSLDSMLSRGVKNFCYKTLRYPGHRDLIKFMIDDLKMDMEEFNLYIQRSCPKTEKDMVFLAILTNSKYISPREIQNLEMLNCVHHDSHWTAMQKATSFPIAAVASLIVEGEIDKKNILTYADVPFIKMQKKLNQIGDFPILFQ